MDIEDLESRQKDIIDDGNGQKGIRLSFLVVVTSFRNFCRFINSL